MQAPLSRPLARGGREGAGLRAPTLVVAARAHWPLLLALCAGVATAFYRLGARGLWGDEVWQVAWAQQQPLPQTFQRFSAPPDLPLSFLLVQLATTFNSDPFWVRLPSALLGAATVALLYLLGRRLCGRATGLAAALLLAVAPYHVWYAQDARPYAALACYSLLTLLFFERLLRRPAPWVVLGFTVATILNLYNHLFALFPLFVEVVAGLAWVALSWPRARHARRADGATDQTDQTDQAAHGRLPRVAGGIVGGAAVALAAAFPLFAGVARYIVQGGPVDGGDTPIRLTPGAVVDLLGLFGSGRGWPLLLTVALFSVGLGALAYRRSPFVGIALAWLVLPLAALWLAHPHHMFIPRYVLFMQPVYLLLVAHGLVSLAGGAATLLPWPSARLHKAEHDYGRPGASLRAALTAGAVAVVAAVTFTPAWRAYGVEKVNDWSAICAYLHRSAGLGDAITGNSYTGGLMDWCFKGSTDVSLVPPGSYALPALAAGGRDVWYILVGAHSPDLPYLRRAYTAVPRAAWARGGLDPITVYDNRFTYPQGEFPATLYHYRATRLPRRVAFHDTPGGALSPTSPDFAQIGLGGRQIVRLRLPATRPRVLKLTVLDLLGRDLDVVADGVSVARLRPRARSLSWRSVVVALPRGLSDDIVLELRNPGTGVSAVSAVELNYAGGHLFAPLAPLARARVLLLAPPAPSGGARGDAFPRTPAIRTYTSQWAPHGDGLVVTPTTSVRSLLNHIRLTPIAGPTPVASTACVWRGSGGRHLPGLPPEGGGGGRGGKRVIGARGARGGRV